MMTFAKCGVTAAMWKSAHPAFISAVIILLIAACGEPTPRPASESAMAVIAIPETTTMATVAPIATITSTATPAPNPLSRWQTSTSIDDLTDENTVGAILPADGSFLSPSLMVRLMVRCKFGGLNPGPNLEIFINWGQVIARESEIYIQITHRLRPGDAVSQTWTVSTNGEATFYPEDERRFLSNMFESVDFLARLTPPGSNPVTEQWTLGGLWEATYSIRENGIQ